MIDTVDGIIECTLWPVGSIGLLLHFEFDMAVWGVGRGPIGLVAPFKLRTLDSQPEKSNMGPVWIDFHDFGFFQKSCESFLSRYLSCFRPGRPKYVFSICSVETKKMCDENICRFGMVSPREVPSVTFSSPFKLFNFRSQFWQDSVH